MIRGIELFILFIQLFILIGGKDVSNYYLLSYSKDIMIKFIYIDRWQKGLWLFLKANLIKDSLIVCLAGNGKGIGLLFAESFSFLF